jgi:uncharacterized protein DUF1186
MARTISLYHSRSYSIQRKVVDTMEIPEILEAFKSYDGEYKREQVEAALELKDEIIPHLINILERLVADPAPYLENDEYFDHIYAVILLSHFGDPRAFQALVDAINITEDMCEQIWSDHADNFIGALLRTFDGSIDKLKAVIMNRDAGALCRTHVAHVIVYAVVEGIMPRQDALDFFSPLFTGTEAEEDSTFWSFLASNLEELCPEEIMPVIEKAYEDELIDPWVIEMEDFANTIERGREYAYEQARQELERWIPTDVHEYMSGWACFRTDRDIPTFDVPSTSPPLGKVERVKIKKKKKKKKMAKASRKKNRR